MIPECLEFYFPGLRHVRCVFTMRSGGASTDPYATGNLSLEVGDSAADVQANRKALQQSLGFTVWQELRQVHGQTIYADLETDCAQGPSLEGDGLCTSRTGHALVMKTADCQAILLTDTLGRYVAALHCGWRGNAINFPATGVHRFCTQYQVDPAQVLVVRGPSLGPGQSEFINFKREWDLSFTPFFDPKSNCVDLWALTRHQLVHAGVLDKHIYSLDLCTASSPQFFSYRRHKVTGRQAALIWLQD